MTSKRDIRALWREFRSLFLKTALALTIFGLPQQGDAKAPPGGEEPAIDRVDEIREKLLRNDRLEGKRLEHRDGRQQMVQWYNWPNWPNWGNWGNWPNWWRNY